MKQIELNIDGVSVLGAYDFISLNRMDIRMHAPYQDAFEVTLCTQRAAALKFINDDGSNYAKILLQQRFEDRKKKEAV